MRFYWLHFFIIFICYVSSDNFPLHENEKEMDIISRLSYRGKTPHRTSQTGDQNSIINLDTTNKHFLMNVSNYQIFFVNALPKTYEKIWSTALVSQYFFSNT